MAVKPTAPVHRRHRLGRAATGFADADGDALSYTYQWFRNGTAISGATGRTLDLSEPGNGDAGDTIAVDVTALDGSGGTSATVRGSQTIGAGLSHPVASYGFEEAAGTAIADESGSNDGAHRRRDAHQQRPLRPRPVLRRRRRHGHGAGRRAARPRDRHDARGLGQAARRHRLAHA